MLTKKQKKILDFIIEYQENHGFSPSYQEITQELGLAARSTIAEHIENLRRAGYLKLEKGRARSLEVSDKYQLLGRSVNIPLVGLITAGTPIEAIEEHETLDVPLGFVNGKKLDKYFALKVRGDSMIEDGILDGDFVICEKNESPKNGEVVVALLDQEYATLKRFYREKNRIKLEPANSRMKPIYTRRLTVQGVVRAVLRKY